MSAEIKIAACGLLCSQCDAYRATIENNPEMLAKVAGAWSQLPHLKDVTSENIRCHGCMSEGPHSIFCEKHCPIRSCAVKRGHAACSQCPDYPCATLNECLNFIPDNLSSPMKKLLDAMAEVEKNSPSIFPK